LSAAAAAITTRKESQAPNSESIYNMRALPFCQPRNIYSMAMDYKAQLTGPSPEKNGWFLSLPLHCQPFLKSKQSYFLEVHELLLMTRGKRIFDGE
jgi:hypothetical protein